MYCVKVYDFFQITMNALQTAIIMHTNAFETPREIMSWNKIISFLWLLSWTFFGPNGLTYEYAYNGFRSL